MFKKIESKTILSKSQVHDYTVNPYIGCQHACTYCYARFIKRFTGHKEKWGKFVDIKINSPFLLEQEIKKKKRGRVWVSGVCDPYQPVEKNMNLTRECLEILIENKWPVTIQTKSPLVIRDIDILKKSDNIEVGFSITTSDDKIRRIFEPNAPSIEKRLEALKELQSHGIKAFVMIAPILPNVIDIPELLIGKVDYVLIDRMNYHYSDWVYKKFNLKYALKEEFFNEVKIKLQNEFEKTRINYQIMY
jgi:DNA repair photolyase